jgi:predicted transcriptional regulator
MKERRAMGALEREVLRLLWSAREPLTPGQVADALGADTAYTTAMTVLTRLWQKGLVDRQPAGRAYAYSAQISEAELAAQRMSDAMSEARDRVEALSRFVGRLTPREAKALRKLLDGEARPR